MAEWARKRFWKATEVRGADGGYEVTLDARPVRTPAKSALILPTRALADAVAAEWDAQGDRIDPLSMPATRSANAAIDKVVTQIDEVAAMVAAYGDADLLCYRADGPEALIARQAASWDPYLDWAAARFGARLIPVEGVMHQPQAPAALAALDRVVRGYSAFEMTALHDLVSLTGSLVLGLATAEAHRPADEIWQVSRLDEDWQIDQWGEDEEAQAAAAAKRGAFLHAHRFLTLVRAR